MPEEGNHLKSGINLIKVPFLPHLRLKLREQISQRTHRLSMQRTLPESLSTVHRIPFVLRIGPNPSTAKQVSSSDAVCVAWRVSSWAPTHLPAWSDGRTRCWGPAHSPAPRLCGRRNLFPLVFSFIHSYYLLRQVIPDHAASKLDRPWLDERNSFSIIWF